MKQSKKLLIVVVTIVAVGTIITTSTFAYTSKDISTKHHRNNTRVNENKNPKTIGVVSSIDGTNITITKNSSSEKIIVDASKSIINKFTPTGVGSKPTPTLITIQDIKVGDTLIIEGTLSGENITATTITDGSLGQRRVFNK